MAASEKRGNLLSGWVGGLAGVCVWRASMDTKPESFSPWAGPQVSSKHFSVLTWTGPFSTDRGTHGRYRVAPPSQPSAPPPWDRVQLSLLAHPAETLPQASLQRWPLFPWGWRETCGDNHLVDFVAWCPVALLPRMVHFPHYQHWTWSLCVVGKSAPPFTVVPF